MSFFFAKNNHKIKLGQKISIKFKSLQLQKNATKYEIKNVFKSTYYNSPMYKKRFITIIRKAKRASLSTHLNGSITVETAFVLPLFVFAMISLLYFINIIFIQLTIQIQLENTAKLINSSTCITTAADINLSDEDKFLLERIVYDASGTFLVNEIFLTEELKDFLDNTLIVDGSEGLSFIGTNVTNTDKPLDIVVSYKTKIPFIPEDIFTFDISQHCYFKAFNGRNLSRNIFFYENYVYVTEDGDVFHANRFCSHLSRFTSLRNLDELKKEYPDIAVCSFCNKSTNLISRPTLGGITYVYVTVENDAYHLVEACPHLQRHLIRLDYDDARAYYTPCSRCVVYTGD